MSRRATFTAAELRRAQKVARETGCLLEVSGTTFRFLPIDPDATLPSPDLSDSDWAARLAQWRHSA